MKINTLYNTGKPVFSLEIFPPKKTTAVDALYHALDTLADLKPDYISVTYGAGGGQAGNQTCALASYIKHSLHIEPLAHLTCVNTTRQQLLDTIADLRDHDIENILALRGDITPTATLCEEVSHASDLARLIGQQSGFHIAGACYPEGHFESPSLDADIQNLHQKIDAGAAQLITQLFFDNTKFYTFQEKLAAADIHVPVSAGIMPIVTTKQLERTLTLSGASLPVEFTHMVGRYANNSQALYHAGIAYAIEQIQQLLEHGVDGIHLYTMNNPQVAQDIYNGIREELGR